MPADPTPPASHEEPARAAFEARAVDYALRLEKRGGGYAYIETALLWSGFQAGVAWQAARAHDTAADHVGDDTEMVTAASPQEGAQAGAGVDPCCPAGLALMLAAAPAPQEGGA